MITGELPTTGAARSGPVGWPLIRGPFTGVRPIAMRVPAIQLDSEIERRPVVDGIMSDPTGPYVIAWYGATGKLGRSGNVVMAGHYDYAGVGPAVFARIDELQPGDLIELTGENIELYQYSVTWSKLVELDKATVVELTSQTETETITLITCGGNWDAAQGAYSHRYAVRAERSH